MGLGDETPGLQGLIRAGITVKAGTFYGSGITASTGGVYGT